MTAQDLYESLQFLSDLDNQLGLQRSLESVVEALNNLVSSPANPAHQNALANALQTFTAAASKLSDAVTPARMLVITEMGGGEFFEAALGDRIRTSIEKNAMTPAVARDFARDTAARRSTFLEVVRNTASGMGQLKIRQTALPPGAADLAFLIPRDIFKNHLDAFAKELAFIDRLVQHIGEGATGSAKPVVLTTISSSTPTIGLETALKVIELLATIVTLFLNAWEKIGKIRKIRGELADVGMTGPLVEHLTNEITRTIDEVVEESTEVVLVSYSGEDSRRHELKNALTKDTRRLFGQIERGLNVEFRANAKADASEEDKKALDTISQLSRSMVFPPPDREPILLASGELLDDDNHPGEIVLKRTTTRKATTRKQTEEVKPTP